MSEHFSTISILHCGGEKEVTFIKYLQQALAESARPPFNLEYTNYRERQVVETIMCLDAEKYKREGNPIIMLISNAFFDTIWPTSYKDKIINVITSRFTKNCLHVWLDVDECDVRRRSVVLLSRQHNFQRVHVDDLVMDKEPSQNDDVLERIRLRLQTNGSHNILNNYAIDDEGDEMRRNYLMHYGLPSSPSIDNKRHVRENNKRDAVPIKKPKNVDEEIIRHMASMKVSNGKKGHKSSRKLPGSQSIIDNGMEMAGRQLIR